MFTKTEIDLASKVYEALKKIAERQGKKWEWEPEFGEWLIYRSPKVIGETVGIIDYIVSKKVICFAPEEGNIHYDYCEIDDGFIPILHWEKLEGILEDLGYEVIVYRYKCEVWAEEDTGMRLKCRKKGQTRQEAVMRAVIKLAGDEEKK